MKRFVPLVLIFLLGCSGPDPAMEAALELRSRCLSTAELTFRTDIHADYITQIEVFSLECTAGAGDELSFRVLAPEDIADIRGSVREDAGTVEFEETVLAFPLMAQGRLSPLSGPWVVWKALRTGCIIAAGQEGDALHLTIDDSYADNALTVDLWLTDGQVAAAEIAWEGRRCLSMTFDGFSA